MNGFSDWKDGPRRFRNNQTSDPRLEAQAKFSSDQVKVDEFLSEKIKTTRATNRIMMKEVIRCIVFLSKQNIAFRGKLLSS